MPNNIASAIYAFALKLTKNDFDAQNLQQEAFVKAFQNRNSFKEDTNFKVWISTILRNTFINQYRKKRILNFAEESIESYDYDLRDKAISNLSESELMMQELTALLDALDEKYRTPFLMAYQDYGYQER